jgi:hypothetical protein
MKIIYERLKIIIKNTLEYINKAYENDKINIRNMLKSFYDPVKFKSANIY